MDKKIEFYPNGAIKSTLNYKATDITKIQRSITDNKIRLSKWKILSVGSISFIAKKVFNIEVYDIYDKARATLSYVVAVIKGLF